MVVLWTVFRSAQERDGNAKKEVRKASQERKPSKRTSCRMLLAGIVDRVGVVHKLFRLSAIIRDGSLTC